MYDSLRATYQSNLASSHVCSHGQLTSLLDTPGINVLRDGHYVSRTSDFIVYSVEAESIHDVVAEYGPCELFGCVKIASDFDR
jgi:prephenate dehydrogenase (NADP+)